MQIWEIHVWLLREVGRWSPCAARLVPSWRGRGATFHHLHVLDLLISLISLLHHPRSCHLLPWRYSHFEVRLQNTRIVL